jgi:hypothetical protein
MMFAINFGKVRLMAGSPVRVLECPRVRIVLDEEPSQDDDMVTARLVLERNTASVKGLQAIVAFDDAGFTLLDVSRGSLLGSQASPVFFVHHADAGDLQVHLAGLGNMTAIQGSGEVAVLRFLRKGVATSLPELSSADLRGIDNRRLSLKAEPVTDRLSEEPASGSPSAARLSMSPSPNPFRKATSISFSLPATGKVSLDVYDVEGRLVRTIVDEVLPAGNHSAFWDGTTNGGQGLAPGTYMSVLTLGDTRIVRKLTLLP